MEKESIEMQKRKNRIISWLKNPYNSALLAVLLFAFAVRLYFFWITRGQAVWWDEGEYMLRVKHIVLDTPQSGFFKARELFTPYFWAAIYWITHSEVAIRFVQVIISTITILVAYLFGKEVYDKKTGIIGALFMSGFWLHLFFTSRLLTYLYAPLFYTLALVLFWKGYIQESKKKDRWLFLSFLTIILGIGIYSSIAFAAITILVYLLFTEQLTFLKNKRLWKNAFYALPFILVSAIPSYFVQGSFIPRAGQVMGLSDEGGAGFAGLFTYINMMPHFLLTVNLIILIVSLILVLRFLFYFDFVLKNKETGKVRNDFFVFICALIPFVFYTWVSIVAGGSGGANYDAWILPIFPALFVFMSRFLIWIENIAKDKSKGKKLKKIIALIFAIIILFSIYTNVKFANDSIKAKLPSFYNLKPAGEWIKDNSEPSDKIYSAAIPEITYYSEREVISHDAQIVNNSKEGFVKLIYQEKPKYIVLTLWEISPEWVFEAVNTELNVTPVNAYFLDKEKTQADVVIYEVNY